MIFLHNINKKFVCQKNWKLFVGQKRDSPFVCILLMDYLLIIYFVYDKLSLSGAEYLQLFLQALCHIS